MKEKNNIFGPRPGEFDIMKGLVNRGYLYERTEFNPLEKAFAEQWEQENEERSGINYGQGLLQDLFIDGRRDFPLLIHNVTDKERWVAATVIQWLGSNCGMSFMDEALRRAGYRIESIPRAQREIEKKKTLFPRTHPRKFDFEA